MMRRNRVGGWWDGCSYTVFRGRLWGCSILAGFSPVSGVMAGMGRAVGVVRQNRSVLSHITGFDMGFDMAIKGSNFEGPDVGVLGESNNAFGTVRTMWQRRVQRCT
jgi:hypothetical protein